MFKRSQTVALGLALVITVSVLAGLDHLATQQHAGTALACAGESNRHWVVVAPPAPRS
jgi:hypothetical protein